MTGQPVGEFDLTSVEVTYEESTFDGNNLAILDLGETFEVTVKFEGMGIDWENFQELTKPDGFEYKIQLYAEGIGIPPYDVNLFDDTFKIPSNDPGPYERVCRVTNGINQEGVFRLAAMVTFPRLTGWLGFLEGPLIQVHPQEG